MNYFLRIFLYCIVGITTAYAQNPNRVTIQGSIQDTTETPLPAATILLLQPKDSALVDFSRSDEKGFFSFKNVKNTGYLLKISYVSYLPFQRSIPISTTQIIDLGVLRIKPVTKELQEVVIQGEKNPLSIQGDTLTYDATTFKVQLGSAVEELLRRIPGVEIDAQGNVKTHGKDINKILVNGKSFFGNNPKTATKNLDADMVSKIQIFNEKSEQSRITGIDDGNDQKVMNLVLKSKTGVFGKASIGGGTQSRWMTRGNYNIFNQKHQFSILGYGNNINNSDMRNEDGMGGLAGLSMNAPPQNLQGGFIKNFGGGVSYAYIHKKTNLSANYMYIQSNQTLDKVELKQTFQPTSSFFTIDTTSQTSRSNNHNLNLHLEQKIDSSNILTFNTSLQVGISDKQFAQIQNFQTEEGVNKNTLANQNGNHETTFRLNTTVDFRHNFNKKGRVMSLGGSYWVNTSDDKENSSSLNRFFEATGPENQTKSIRQFNTNTSQQHDLKGNASFVEPLSDRIYLETTYNLGHMNRVLDRNVFNAMQGNIRLDSLSTYYTNQVVSNKLGSGLRYTSKKVNISAGIAGLHYDLSGNIGSFVNNPHNDRLSRTFTAIAPSLSATINITNNTGIIGNIITRYNLNVQIPQLRDLQPVIQNNNPYFISSGNPDLSPQRSHQLTVDYQKFNLHKSINLSTSVVFDYYLNQIIYTQTIDEKFVTRTRPENISGGKSLRMNTSISFPLIKNKLTMSANGTMNVSISPTYINKTQNETDNRIYTLNTGLTIIPSSKLYFTTNVSISFNTITYSIEKQQNQKIQTYGLNNSLQWNFAKKFFFESNLNYTNYSNDRFGFNQNIPIMNASVRKRFLKSNKLEMKLAAFDIFNQNVNITQQGVQNSVVQQTTQTLARYFMLSLSYKLGTLKILQKLSH